MYGSTHQIYGSKACARCGRYHGRSDQVLETHGSRFKLMRLLVELQLTPMLARRTGADVPALNADRMFGVLVTPEKTFATHSGDLLDGATPFLLLAKSRKMTLALTQEEKQGKHTARAGVIPQHIYQSAKVAGAYKPGNCAAPRLIEAALKDPDVSHDPMTWSMSEVMYNPTGSNQQWWHGLTANSCDTCEKLVPMLLCPTGKP